MGYVTYNGKYATIGGKYVILGGGGTPGPEPFDITSSYAFWTFDGQTLDSSTARNIQLSSIYGTPTYDTGKVGPYSISFGGNAVIASTDASLGGFVYNGGATPHEFTLALWFKTGGENDGIYQTLWSFGSPDGGFDISLQIYSDGTCHFVGPILTGEIITSSVADDHWHLAISKFDGIDSWTFKLDDTSIGTITTPNGLTSKASEGIIIGAVVLFPGFYLRYFTGEIDEILFLPYATSEEEDSQIWNNGTGL